MMLVNQAVRAAIKRRKRKAVKRKNVERVKAALKALEVNEPDETLADGSPALVESNFVDMVTNLCHLAHQEGVDMQNVFRIAWNHYEAEA